MEGRSFHHLNVENMKSKLMIIQDFLNDVNCIESCPLLKSASKLFERRKYEKQTYDYPRLSQ